MMQAWKELVDEYEKILNFQLREEKIAYIAAVIISIIISAFMEYIFILTNLVVFAIINPVIMFLYFLWYIILYYTALLWWKWELNGSTAMNFKLFIIL